MDSMYKVCVRSYTYNHAQFIEDAMNGFVMQKTDFPFVATIVDDASTDNAQQVITDYFEKNFDTREPSIAFQEETDYGKVLFARHNANKNCFFAIVLLKENHYRQKKSKLPYISRWKEKAEYIALCEGDDYWTDPLKLQKQVCFLDAHSDYSLCCHRFKIYIENTGQWRDDYSTDVFSQYPDSEGIDVTNSENFRYRFTQTLTLCYRAAVLERIVFPPYKTGLRDFNLHYHLLKEGKGYCFSEYMGVYRRNSGGIWSRHTPLEKARVRLDCYQEMYRYNKDDQVVLERYCEWLDRFYKEFVLPPFQRHKITRNGLKNLVFDVKHNLKTQRFSSIFRHFWGCITAFFHYR